MLKLMKEDTKEALDWMRTADFRENSLGRLQLMIAIPAILTLIIAAIVGTTDPDFYEAYPLTYSILLLSYFGLILAIVSFLYSFLPLWSSKDEEELRRARLLAAIMTILLAVTAVALILIAIVTLIVTLVSTFL